MYHDLSSTDVVRLKLESIHFLDDEDRDAVNRLPVHIAELKADQDVVREGDRPSRSCLILGGLACWSKVTGTGRRQILSFQIPGDLPDLHSLHLTKLDSTLTTLTPSRVAFIQHEALRDVCVRRPNLANAFWRMTLIDAAIFREWVANVGSRQAYSRVAHLLCELVLRMEVVGLSKDRSFELAVTQTELADATGLSAVHVNRTLKMLRKNLLISWEIPCLKYSIGQLSKVWGILTLPTCI